MQGLALDNANFYRRQTNGHETEQKSSSDCDSRRSMSILTGRASSPPAYDIYLLVKQSQQRLKDSTQQIDRLNTKYLSPQQPTYSTSGETKLPPARVPSETSSTTASTDMMFPGRSSSTVSSHDPVSAISKGSLGKTPTSETSYYISPVHRPSYSLDDRTSLSDGCVERGPRRPTLRGTGRAQDLSGTTPVSPPAPSTQARSSAVRPNLSIVVPGKRHDSRILASLRGSVLAPPQRRASVPAVSPNLSSGSVFSSPNHAQAGVFHDLRADVNKPLPPVPQPSATYWTPTLTSMPLKYGKDYPSPIIPAASSDRFSASSERGSASSKWSSGSRTPFPELDRLDRAFVNSSPYAEIVPPWSILSPTLSEATHSLEEQLEDIAKGRGLGISGPHGDDAVKNSVDLAAYGYSTASPPSRDPIVPAKSRQREWHANQRRNGQTGRNDAATLDHSRSSNSTHYPAQISRDEPLVESRRKVAVSGPQLRRVSSPTVPSKNGLTGPVISKPSIVPGSTIDDGLIVVESPKVMSASTSIEPDPKNSAERVLPHIFPSLDSLSDLFSVSMINRETRRVYKAKEKQFLSAVLHRQSPPAAEFLQWSVPESDGEPPSAVAESPQGYTPRSYIRCYKKSLAMIQELKEILLEQCQTVLRPETRAALSTPKHPDEQRFNDAFWRIWCFCEIFGNGKGREDDVAGQLDWLKGGKLAHNQDVSATVNLDLDFELDSVLLNAPHFFARGNPGGLDAQQLYDMTEIWTCLATLLQAYQGLTTEARAHGIFDPRPDIPTGDLQKEERLLEAWTAHILTLGPAAILPLARHATTTTNNPAAGLALAHAKAWTTWTPADAHAPNPTTFLKDPVARLYHTRIAGRKPTLSPEQTRHEETRSRQRRRGADLAKEIKRARQIAEHKKIPVGKMSSERPMSCVSSSPPPSSSSPSAPSNPAPAERPRRKPVLPPLSTTVVRPNAPVGPLPPPQLRSSPQPTSIPPSHPPSHQHQPIDNPSAPPPPEAAVFRIVEMGFTPSQARQALRVTRGSGAGGGGGGGSGGGLDGGDPREVYGGAPAAGILGGGGEWRVERAVELLCG